MILSFINITNKFFIFLWLLYYLLLPIGYGLTINYYLINKKQDFIIGYSVLNGFLLLYIIDLFFRIGSLEVHNSKPNIIQSNSSTPRINNKYEIELPKKRRGSHIDNRLVNGDIDEKTPLSTEVFFMDDDKRYVLSKTKEQVWAQTTDPEMYIYQITGADVMTISDISALWNYTTLTSLSITIFWINFIVFLTWYKVSSHLKYYSISLLVSSIMLILTGLIPNRIERIKPKIKIFCWRLTRRQSNLIHLTGVSLYIFIILKTFCVMLYYEWINLSFSQKCLLCLPVQSIINIMLFQIRLRVTKTDLIEKLDDYGPGRYFRKHLPSGNFNCVIFEMSVLLDCVLMNSFIILYNFVK